MSKEILFFSAPWCEPCKQIKESLNEKIRDEINIKLIDITKDMDLATSHQIMSVPTFVVLKDGVEVSRKIGSTTIENLQKM
jgi:thioredoxin 1